jgi:hypothetical protein
LFQNDQVSNDDLHSRSFGLLISPFLLFLTVQKYFLYLVHWEDHKFKNSSPFLEKDTLVSSYITQVDKPLLLFPSVNNDEPLALVSFEIFLEQKVQIPILPKHSKSCKLVENETYIPAPTVSSIPSEQPAKIHPWVINRYKPLKFPSFLHDLPPKILNIFLNSMEKMMFQQKSTWYL